MQDSFNDEKTQIKMSKIISKCSINDNLVVAICGGDGGCSWAINCLIGKCRMHCNDLCNTMWYWNDLSRVSGWGATQISNRKQAFSYYKDIHFCSKITKRYWMLDKWKVEFEFLHL